MRQFVSAAYLCSLTKSVLGRWIMGRMEGSRFQISIDNQMYSGRNDSFGKIYKFW